MSPSSNRAMLEEKIFQLGNNSDLVVLPELFTTGFGKEAVIHAEPMNLTTFKWMKQMANFTKALIIGSYPVADGKQVFNRLIAMKPDGSFQTYDKRHLFSIANENQYFSNGKSKIIIEWKSWKICPLVCYDLRFPVWSRQNKTQYYDLLLYVANWPSSRITSWDCLLQARAIENVAYSAGCNIIGIDGQHLEYNGHSSVFDFKGEKIMDCEDNETIKSVTLLKRELESFREKFSVLKDSDSYTIL